MKPSIGRIVVFVSNDKPHAAVITSVEPRFAIMDQEREQSYKITLRCFGQHAIVGDMGDFMVYDPKYSPIVLTGHWSWPPRV